MANIFSIFGSIFIDNEKANKEIDTTKDKGKGLTSSLGSGFATVGKTAIGMAATAGAAAVALVGGFTAAANKTGEYAGAILDASRKTSINTTMLQELKYAGEQAGVSFEKLVGGAAKFNKTFSEAATGTGTGIKAFESLGIAINDVNGKARDSSAVFNDTLLKLAEMGDTAEMNALGNQIFGRSFAEMKPLLAEGAAGIEQLRAKAQELGIVMDEGAIIAGDNFADTFASLQQALGGVANQLITALLPAIQPLIDMLIDNMPMISSLIQQLAPPLMSLLTSIMPPLMSLIQLMLPIIIDAITRLAPLFTALFTQLLPPLIEFISAILPVLIDLIMELLPPIIDIVNALLPVILQILLMLLPPLVEIIKALLPALMPIIKAILPIIKPILDVLLFLINTVLLPLINIFTIIMDIVGKSMVNNFTLLKNAVNGIGTVFQNVFGAIMGFVKPPLNFIIDALNTFIKGINKLKIPDWVPGVGGKGINLPTIPRLAKGLNYVPYDEFPAFLHKGERVLTAKENREYSDNKIIVRKEDVNERLISLMESFMERMMGLQVVMDTGEVVGVLASPMDNELRKIIARRER